MIDELQSKGTLAGRQLLPREAALYLWDEGWVNFQKLVEAIATMKQESRFYTQAEGGPNSNGTYDWGWMQINSGHRAKFGFTDLNSFKQACFDPAQCVKFGRRLYVDAGYSLRPWVAFTSGAYEQFLDTGVEGAANMMGLKLGLTPSPLVRLL